MDYTPFAGLTALAEDDPITIDGGSFLTRNPRITDALLRIGALTHHHDERRASPNPITPLVGTVVASGGSLPADSAFSLTYTVVDQHGGETTKAPAITLITPPTAIEAITAPSAAVDTTQGIMPDGAYFYATTITDGAGGETLIGPSTAVAIDPGYASGSVRLSGLTADLPGLPSATWRLWRSYEGEDWHLAAQGTADTYLDTGFDPPDNPALPPDASTIGANNSIHATLPAHDAAFASGATIRLYLATDPGFPEPCLYGEYPTSAAGTLIAIASETVRAGSPPRVSTAISSPTKIYPDTELRFGVKTPVATTADLPHGVRGDIRVVEDNGHLYAVLGETAEAPGDWTDLISSFSGVTVTGPGAPYTVWEPLDSSAAPSGAIGEFADAGGGAHLTMVDGLLTTTDALQVDPIQGPAERYGGSMTPLSYGWTEWYDSTGATRHMLSFGSDTTCASVPADPDYPNPHTLATYYVDETAAVAAFVAPSGVNYPRDTLKVMNSGPRNSDDGTLLGVGSPGGPDEQYARDTYYWDGSAWRLLSKWVGPALVSTVWFGSNEGLPRYWDFRSVGRPEPDHPNIYAYKWTGGGPRGEGVRLRVRFANPAALARDDSDLDRANYFFPAAIGVVLNMTDAENGLTYYPGGWTKKPSDLMRWGEHYPPERVRDDGSYAFGGEQPLGGALYQDMAAGWAYDPTGDSGIEWGDIHGGPTSWRYVFSGWPNAVFNDLWLEVWREGNRAHAAVYDRDPATRVNTLPVTPFHTSTFAEDLTGTDYDGSTDGYFGIVVPFLNQDAGIRSVEIVAPVTEDIWTYEGVEEVDFTEGSVYLDQPKDSAVRIAIASGGAGAWKDPVATAADLPVAGNVDGDVRVTRDDAAIYVWAAGDTAWHLASGAIGPAGPPGDFHYEGAWVTGTTYTAQAVVERAGSAYSSLAGGNVGHDPATDGGVHWGLVAQRGTDGIDGADGAPGLNWRDTYNAGTSYAVNDAVAKDGSSYISITNANVGHDPVTDGGVHWAVLAQKGEVGVIGATQQSGDYTFVLADQGTVVEGTDAAAQTFTVPPGVFPDGAVMEVFQDGAGSITIAPGAGVTLRSDGGKVRTNGRYATAGLRHRSADEWVLSGDLA